MNEECTYLDLDYLQELIRIRSDSDKTTRLALFFFCGGWPLYCCCVRELCIPSSTLYFLGTYYLGTVQYLGTCNSIHSSFSAALSAAAAAALAAGIL